MLPEPRDEEAHQQPAGGLLMLPGLGESAPISHDLEDATRIMVEARRSAGILSDLDDATVALLLANARKLDASVGQGRPSGRAKLLHAMSDTLDQLPAPQERAGGLLQRFAAALTGSDPDDEEEPAPTDLPAPEPPEPSDNAGIQERGVLTTLRARHAAGLSVTGWAAHESLALMASRDIDGALHGPGAPSGFAALAAAMATILERLPRPEETDNDTIEQLFASLPPRPSPFTRLPPATHHPERDPSWESEGEEIAAVARAMGRDLMPWQRKAIDVATEYRADERGHRRYRYGTVIITVPRQSGKTDLMAPVQLHRILTRGLPATAWFTAQSGQDARKRMLEILERVENSPLRSLLTSTRSNGAEGLRVTELPGAHLTRFSPTMKALHGEHPHLVTLDEFWHLDKTLGDALIGAIEPSQITLGSRAQTWMISTMGTHASEFMNEWIELGRAGTDPSICFIEYSLADDLDPFDPESWKTFHPALGNTIDIADLAARAERARDNPARRATFLRAYCNRLVASDGGLIDLALWDDLGRFEPRPPEFGDVTLGVETAPTGSTTSVVAAWTDAETGRPCVRIVREMPGTRWVPGFVADLVERWSVPVVADGAGPTGGIVQALLDAGVDVRRLTMAEFGQATEAMLAACGPDRTLIHDGTDTLRLQAANAVVRISNGVRRFARDPERPIPAIIAGAVAMWASEHPPASDELGSFIA